MKRRNKKEALAVTRLIHEVLVNQLSIPFRQIVNDSNFSKYTGTERPDLLVSEFGYDGTNDDQFIANLVGYAEVKDKCAIGDAEWRDALAQGQKKTRKLNLPYFIVTNCSSSIFYNATTLEELTLNKNQIREFQTIDILRLIKSRLGTNPKLSDIQTNVDSISAISEAIFNKKLWELATIYREINFKNNQVKIDFTIGFVSLEFYEEKSILDNTKDKTKIYWSDCDDEIDEKLVGNLTKYVERLSKETNFREFDDLINTVRVAISDGDVQLVSNEQCRGIYKIINSMRPLHGTGFDLFGAVYEMFASAKEKKEFGEYFTRRHYAHVFAKLCLKNEMFWNPDRKFTVLDPACGTGGFLTESYKVLKNNYERNSGAYSKEFDNFLQSDCFYGIDVRDDNISRTKLNMFLVGDGHTNIARGNALNAIEHPLPVDEFDYIITNPPYGAGTIRAATSSVSTTRTEIAFLCRVRELLKIGGHACVIQPDGVLENPSFALFRRELLETLSIVAIISLPKFAFAPYTKEKTYAVYFTKRSDSSTPIQRTPIWMYVIDNDGLANSDKRFPTKLRNNRNGWLHDEISGWVTTDGIEMPGLLEERWCSFDDSRTPTEWLSEKGENLRLRKGGNIDIDTVIADKYTMLLPEYYLRSWSPAGANVPTQYQSYQAKDFPVSGLFDITGGNSGLTEEFLYSLLTHDEDKRYKLLTGSVDVSTAPYIFRCQNPKNPDKKISVVEGEECIHVVRKGKAGHINYLPVGNYTMTDDAYVLTLRKDAPFQLSLEWLAETHTNLFKEFASSSDNSTWNKGGFLSHASIDIPSYEEQIRAIGGTDCQHQK